VKPRAGRPRETTLTIGDAYTRAHWTPPDSASWSDATLCFGSRRSPVLNHSRSGSHRQPYPRRHILSMRRGKSRSIYGALCGHIGRPISRPMCGAICGLRCASIDGRICSPTGMRICRLVRGPTCSRIGLATSLRICRLPALAKVGYVRLDLRFEAASYEHCDVTTYRRGLTRKLDRGLRDGLYDL
jgi:hypothetical protein